MSRWGKIRFNSVSVEESELSFGILKSLGLLNSFRLLNLKTTSEMEIQCIPKFYAIQVFRHMGPKDWLILRCACSYTKPLWVYVLVNLVGFALDLKQNPTVLNTRMFESIRDSTLPLGVIVRVNNVSMCLCVLWWPGDMSRKGTSHENRTLKQMTNTFTITPTHNSVLLVGHYQLQNCITSMQ